MKLSDLRPCDGCGKPLTNQPYGGRSLQFYRVRVTTVLVNPRALQQVAAMAQFFGGKSLQLAEIFSPDPDVAVPLSEREPQCETELLLCMTCYCCSREAGGLAGMVERREEAGKAVGR